MHVYFLSRKYFIGLLGCAFVLAGGVMAAPVAHALEIHRFEANPVNELAPGTELVFRLEGTPQARATVTVSGLSLSVIPGWKVRITQSASVPVEQVTAP